MMALNPQRMRWILLALLLAAGVIVRVIFFGMVPPSGLNLDEAYVGYEAFSLGTYGIDSEGYPNPVYLVTWGGGMSALASYLAIPFVKLLGTTAIAVRLPQLICGVASLPVFYLLMCKLFSPKTALVALALLAFCPWHIMMCRWGLDCNLAPAFYLTGLLFLVQGIEDSRFWMLSALFFGIGLYAYAIMWALIPLTLLVVGLYLFSRRAALRRFQWRWLVISLLILFIWAFPLILFILVNKGVIPEIVTPVLSIPTLAFMRMGEFTLANLLNGESWLTAVLQWLGFSDGYAWSAIPEFGLFYYVSIPFIILGFGVLVVKAIKSVRLSGIDGGSIALGGWSAAFLVCLMTEGANVNKANCLHLYSLIFAAVGLVWVCGLIARAGRAPARVAAAALVLVYGGFAGSFVTCYFTEYDEYPAVRASFNEGLPDALAWIQENVPSNVTVGFDVTYPNILYLTQFPAPEFVDTVVYPAEHTPYRYPDRFGRYIYGYPDVQDPDVDCVYLYESDPDRIAFFQDHDFEVLEFESCFVAYYPEQ